jgi:3',5'-cyclic AMP phosphodiesterase CpdA
MVANSPGSDQANAQLAWIDADLAKASMNRTKHPFLVFVNHRPQFSTSHHSADGDVLRVRDSLVPIFHKYGVDVVFGGHDHDFERSKPLSGAPDNPTVGTTGTTYIVSAGAGASAYGPGGGTVAYRAVNGSFGNGTPWVGLYTLAKLDAGTMTITTYGLKASATNVMGDDVIDTVTLTR